MESSAPSGSSALCAGSRDSGTSQRPASSAAATKGRLTRKTRFQSPCSSSQPPATGPMAMPRPAMAAHAAIAFGALVGGEDVDEDGQGRGHDEGAADAHEGAGGDELRRVGGQRGERRAGAEHEQAGGEGALAAEAVAEAAGGQQQAGEDEHVGVEIHCSWLDDASRSPRMLGRATLRIVLSSPITRRLARETASVHQRRRWRWWRRTWTAPYRNATVLESVASHTASAPSRCAD